MRKKKESAIFQHSKSRACRASGKYGEDDGSEEKEAEQKKAAERKNQEMAKVRPDTRQANRIKNPAENYQELRNIEPEEGETEAEIQVFDGQEYNPKLDSGSEAMVFWKL